MKNDAPKKRVNTKSTPMHSLQRCPSRAEREALKKNPKPNGAEAIAMRRVVVEMGYWLSPFMNGYPLPVLTEYEQAVDLVALERSRQGKSGT